ncbi:2-oxo-Delta(3)-4,5,5-trimethylcyclopentenylacetyl-CoA monooxygenase [Pseudomonas monteilii]|uniref:2-oxo-Delta(3)-4,5,5-trimethylcyclopentenylacetyl-CoA monooxygenase n=1 Tax=Pseudomonas putida TaxID=303 RepID=OTEMO_PSEPU|nr:2-oxo-Delta(3)-4,5,5-trimethylcyclopentenylacetyl-CoA monooxygenase [Pseudomonas monteilii]H3JQW0.1 RecName: Full=2-oxo-Delta(3)-4,5,5-trimethylcyclopentenylacetyl-CoA monooxygenase; Short=OTEMO; AltName: Full=(2,2,3-trimethyl-5-oxocyclopent-3-enyl)acetyl-CoA 1,5-monooxygenase; AltName: Full=MO2 [Pseudomonas putida]3UOV_A Chain A, OTEMO [Pseudomonas putida]3UOV_B Chain B, OTEMO [Pseudomonas putida]3UOX_A Chain A, OTEMO [Pseudomonas putida]3UOX_B Chain B, OTEMO [Pseudomonas putida]3UOY_A Ch
MSNRAKSPALDAVVIGAGVTGIYQAFLINQAGMKVLGIEAGEDVGGTWYWNRYPGCRLDTESYAYGYFALKGIIPEWEWSENFASQPEMLRYVNRAADAMDVRKHYRFNTRVTAARYVENDRLWEVTLDNEEVVTCRFLISATGPLSASRMPDIKGIDSFKGESFHSSRWPTDAEGAPKGVDFTGKRVGVIGTGATGVQIIPIAAETAKELYVFQRTPNWCTPLGNSPMSKEKMDSLRNRYPTILEYVKSTDTAFPYHRDPRKGTDVSESERDAFFEELYRQPGYGIWLSGFRDLLLNKESNKFLADFVAKKIRQRVKDPVVAEKLIPKDHPFGAKRVPMETNYYETYNRDNVHLVDIREAPIQEVTPEGIKTADAAYDLDVIIYATGFDAVTGSLDRIDIRGKDNVRLIDAWAEGPSTYLGLQARGFPNFFTLVGPHNGSTFCNVGVCGGLQAEWVLRMISYMKDNGFTYSEPTQAAENRWTEEVYADFSRTLLAEANAWWVKTTTKPDGSVVRRTLVHVSGGPEYRKRCEQVAYNNYNGFELA